jgi:hypothetical protein
LPDAIVQPLLKINIGFIAPEFVTEFLATDHFSGTRNQNAQHLQRLGLNAEQCPRSAKLLTFGVELESTETKNPAGKWRRAHAGNLPIALAGGL